MFETICIRNQNPTDSKNPIDLGFLAETMLFYQKVRVVGNHVVLRQLVERIGPDTIIELVNQGFLQISYQTNLAGVNSYSTDSSPQFYSPVLISAPKYTLQNVAPEIFTDVTGKSGRGRRLGNRFASLIDTVEFPEAFTKDVREDFGTTAYVEEAVAKSLKLEAPEYAQPTPLEFRLESTSKGYVIRTNIDFALATQSYNRHVDPSHSTFTAPYLLAQLAAVRENLFISSKYVSEIAVNRTDSVLLQSKFDDIINKHQANQKRIASFQDFVFDDGRRVREVINSREKSFDDLLKLLQNAERFKKWLTKQQPNGDLIKNYFREATASTWVDKLPAKSVRWALITGAGLAADAVAAGGIGTLVGVALGAADAFILDRYLKGWKPNHFVDQVKDFTRK